MSAQARNACSLKHVSCGVGTGPVSVRISGRDGEANSRAARHRPAVGSELHMRSSMTTHPDILARRRCLVCEFAEELWEPANTDEIGPACSRCHAPTERLAILDRRRVADGVNPHAAALGRLGGLRGGPARAAKLTASRRRAIARTAALARWRQRKPEG
jgi:hypothetical protein